MQNRPNLSAVVLAAGLSTRMKRFKPLLKLGKRRVVERVVFSYRNAGIEDIVVVVGYRGEEVRRVLAPLGVQCADNPDYQKGMLSSVLAGVRTLPLDCRAFFLHPADIPLVRPQTVVRLAETFQASHSTVVYPTFNGRRGHPPLIDAGVVPRLLRWSGRGGMRAFLGGYDAASLDLAVADEAVGLDMDTPADYRRMLDRLQHEGVPSRDECRMLMEGIIALPPVIQAHSRAVARIARQVAMAVKKAGIRIDVDQVYAAALLHDIARLEEDHASAGARLLERHGFFRIAPAVATHMALDVEDGRPIDVAQIVYLADKLVQGDRSVGLNQRFSRAMEKFGQDPATASAIEHRLDTARRIKKRVEAITEHSLESLIHGAGEKEGTDIDIGRIKPE